LGNGHHLKRVCRIGRGGCGSLRKGGTEGRSQLVTTRKISRWGPTPGGKSNGYIPSVKQKIAGQHKQREGNEGNLAGPGKTQTDVFRGGECTGNAQKKKKHKGQAGGDSGKVQQMKIKQHWKTENAKIGNRKEKERGEMWGGGGFRQ